MMRSLYSGVSGLRNHQTRMDVIGNNISNVNTAGYKASRVVFQDIYSQLIKSGAAAAETTGGTNPAQIGLGVTMGAIDILHTSAATQRTDNPLDLAIEGDGYFILCRNTDDIETSTGGGGDDVTTVNNANYTRAGNFYVDSEGRLVNADGLFVVGYIFNTEDEEGGAGGGGTEEEPELGIISFTYNYEDGSGDTIKARYKDISIDDTGVIWGLNHENNKVAVAQIALATFSNSNGLEKEGNSLYSATGSSGPANITVSGEGGAGRINPGGLEMSNVDLATEFTDMIVTQRGFQANSRIITTSDSMLEELVNLKR